MYNHLRILLSLIYRNWCNCFNGVFCKDRSEGEAKLGRDEIECSTTLKVNQASIKQDAARGT
jgi:hypothetical protein